MEGSLTVLLENRSRSERQDETAMISYWNLVASLVRGNALLGVF